MRKKLTAALACVAALTLGGCAATSDASVGEPADALTPLKVSVLASADALPVYVAESEGYFEEQGLDVEIVVAQSGAATVPAVINGEVQFAFGNVLSLIVGASKGLPIVAVEAGSKASEDLASSSNAIVVAPDAQVSSAKDLEGKKIAVTSVGNLGSTFLKAWMEQEGADPEAATFVELGFPEMPSALSSGQIDGASILEPFLTDSLERGAVKLVDPHVELMPGGVLSVYFAQQPYIEANADVVDSFKTALDEAFDKLSGDEAFAREAVVEHLEMSEDVANAITLPHWSAGIQLDDVQIVADLAKRYGLSEGDVDLASIIRE